MLKYKDDFVEVWNNDSRDLSFIKDKSVHLVVTSPPYNVRMNYSAYNDALELDEYYNLLRKVFSECYRVLVPGGRIAVNCPSCCRQTTVSKNAFVAVNIHDILKEIGFLPREWVGWVKVLPIENETEYKDIHRHQGWGKSTSWGSWKSPSCFGKGTKILMSDFSWRNIEDIKIGDKVIGIIPTLSYKHHRYHFTCTEVINVFSRRSKVGILNGQTVVTPEHLYFYKNHWIEIQLLNNVSLRYFKGSKEKVDIYSHNIFKKVNFKMTNNYESVFNLTTSIGNYLADGFIVHNCPYVRDVMEYIIIMDKEQSNLEGDKNKIDITRDEFLMYSNNCWFILPTTENKSGHPAAFPEELVYRLMKFYTYQENVILDPFAGSGTVGVVAKRFKRKAILVEIDSGYCDLIKQKVSQEYMF